MPFDAEGNAKYLILNIVDRAYPLKIELPLYDRSKKGITAISAIIE